MFILPLAALVLQGAPAQTTNPVHPPADAVIATIDGTPITAADIDPYLWERYSKPVLNELIGHRLIEAEAKRKGVTATDDEVKKRIEDQVASIKGNLPPGQTVDEFIKSPDVGGMGRLALVARSSILVDKLTALDFKPDGFVKVATLVFRTTGDTTTALGQAIKSADAAYAALQAGKPWETVMGTYEKDPGVRENRGLLGWKAVEVFPESVQAQFKELKPMGYTKPTQTSNGIQIFRLLARGATANATDLAELKGQYVAGSRQAYLAKLRTAAKIEIK